jgi:hypothetical protein
MSDCVSILVVSAFEHKPRRELRFHLPVCGIPDPDAGVQTPGSNLLAVEGNGINLTKMSCKSAQALPFRYAPDFGCGVVATRYYNIAMDFEAPDASLMADKYMFAYTLFEVPNAERCVSRP